MVSTWHKDKLPSLDRVHVETQTELPQKHADIQATGCRECESFFLATSGSYTTAVSAVSR